MNVEIIKGRDIMLTDLNKLKGFDFSKKIIYTDNLSFDELFFMGENKSNRFPVPDKMDLYTSFEDMEDFNYKILYYNLLFELYDNEIPREISKVNSYSFLAFKLDCDKICNIHFYNNIIDVAFSNNHITFSPDYEDYYEEVTLEDAIHQLYTGDELKDILRKYNLPVSGKKGEQVDRLMNNLSDDQLAAEFPIDKYYTEYYALTNEGKELVEKYDPFKYRIYLPIGFNLEEFLEICEKNPQYSSEEIIFCLGYQNWIQLGKNADSLSAEYKTEVGNINADYKGHISNCLIYHHDLAIALLEKIISDGDCEDLDGYKYELENLKEHYEEGRY